MRSVGEWSVEGGVPADYGVEVYAPGLTLAQLELVVKVAKEHSSDFGIGIDARMIILSRRTARLARRAQAVA
jgi:hypothetical protein